MLLHLSRVSPCFTSFSLRQYDDRSLELVVGWGGGDGGSRGSRVVTGIVLLISVSLRLFVFPRNRGNYAI